MFYIDIQGEWNKRQSIVPHLDLFFRWCLLGSTMVNHQKSIIWENIFSVDLQGELGLRDDIVHGCVGEWSGGCAQFDADVGVFNLSVSANTNPFRWMKVMSMLRGEAEKYCVQDKASYANTCTQNPAHIGQVKCHKQTYSNRNLYHVPNGVPDLEFGLLCAVPCVPRFPQICAATARRMMKTGKVCFMKMTARPLIWSRNHWNPHVARRRNSAVTRGPLVHGLRMLAPKIPTVKAAVSMPLYDRINGQLEKRPWDFLEWASQAERLEALVLQVGPVEDNGTFVHFRGGNYSNMWPHKTFTSHVTLHDCSFGASIQQDLLPSGSMDGYG